MKPNDDVDLVNELQRFRGKLLDLSLRNPSLNYRKSARKTLQVVDELPDEVYRRLVELSRPMKLVADLALDAKESRRAVSLADDIGIERVVFFGLADPNRNRMAGPNQDLFLKPRGF